MARPKKNPGEKRDRRLTIYLTQEEEVKLNAVTEHLELDKAKFMIKAMNSKFNRLENPPEQVRQAKYEKIMETEKEQVTGYICSNGHPFWLTWTWPSPPDRCPCCGDKHIKRTWTGRVSKGF